MLVFLCVMLLSAGCRLCKVCLFGLFCMFSLKILILKVSSSGRRVILKWVRFWGGPAGRASTEKLRLTSSIETAFFLKIFSVGISKTKSLRLRSGVERGAGLWKWCNLYRI